MENVLQGLLRQSSVASALDLPEDLTPAGSTIVHLLREFSDRLDCLTVVTVSAELSLGFADFIEFLDQVNRGSVSVPAAIVEGPLESADSRVYSIELSKNRLLRASSDAARL